MTVITDRDLKIAYIDKKFRNPFAFVIPIIDWTLINQCPECHTYFDNGAGTDDNRFCCDDCQDEYVEEAPDREER